MAARPKQGARAEPKAEKKQHVQRTEAEWRKIKLEYVAGKTTLKNLAQKFHVSESTIRKKASSEGWKKRRNKVGTNLEQKALERICDAHAREFETIAQVNDRMSDVLDYLMEFITEQPPTKYDDLRGVESLTKAIAQVVMVKRDLYNMPTEETKAKISAMREKSKLEREKWKQEKAEREAGKKALEDLKIRVEISNDTGEEVGALDE